jgi:hypothetical protein
MDLSIREAGLSEFVEFLGELPDFYEEPTLEEASSRIGDSEYLCLFAESGGEVVGCKLGYSFDNETFYS